MADEISTQSDLVTLEEASSLLRLRPSTLRSWRLKRKKLPFVKFSRRVFVRRSDLEALIASSIEPVGSYKEGEGNVQSG